MFYDTQMASHRSRGIGGVVLVAAIVAAPTLAHADPPWATRRMTLGQGEFAGDVGIGFADDSQAMVTGTGLYMQAGYGITEYLQVLIRDGASFGQYGEYSRAGQYGRLYTTDGSVTPIRDTFGNPDFVLLARFVDLRWLEVGVEAEAGFPMEHHTYVDTTFGVPVTFHYASWLRFDTGGFVTVTYSDPVTASFVAPFELWFQTGRIPFWFGPLTAVSVSHTGTVSAPFGVGAGYALTRDIDLRAQWLVPQVSSSPGINDMGFGVGVEVRLPKLGRQVEAAH